MLEIVPDLLEEMKDNASEGAPDILAASSQVLMDIFSEFVDAELPETLEAHKSRDWVVMNLDEAKQFFGISFKKTWWDHFHKR